MLYTAPCPKGHDNAEWQQLPSINGGAAPYRYEISCPACNRPLVLPTTRPSPVALPPVIPLALRGYYWLRSVVA